MSLSLQQSILKVLLVELTWDVHLRWFCKIIHCILTQKEERVLLLLYYFVFIFLEWLFHLIIIEEFNLTLSLGVAEFIILSNLYLI